MNNDSKVIDLVVRLFFLGLLFSWCFILFRPFVTIILWGAVLAIAWYPLFLGLKALLGGRSKLATILLALLSIGVIAGPVSAIAVVLTSNFQALAELLTTGSIIPPPPASVADWPLIGERLFAIWKQGSVNIGELAIWFEPQLAELAKASLLLARNTGLTLLKFIISVLIAGALTLYAGGLQRGLLRFSERLAPGRGKNFVRLAAATVRNVIRGVIGVAIVQSLLIGIGLIIAGIPAAGLLTVLCLLLAIIQVGPALIILGTLIFAWSTMNTTTALLLTLWMIPATLIDNFLKPIWMARGLPVPMVVIIIGVFGGVLAHGVLGLFVGPVILGLGYELIKAWINEGLTLTLLPTEENR
jgi:predicted PurR-regulated permease PerM